MIFKFVNSLRSFKCAISNISMVDPVHMADGHAYERELAQRWLSSNATSPKTKAALPNKNLLEGIAIKQIMDDHFVDHGVDTSGASIGTFWNAVSEPHEDKAIAQITATKICFKHLVAKDAKDEERNAVHKVCARGHAKIFLAMLEETDDEVNLSVEDQRGLTPSTLIIKLRGNERSVALNAYLGLIKSDCYGILELVTELDENERAQAVEALLPLTKHADPKLRGDAYTALGDCLPLVSSHRALKQKILITLAQGAMNDASENAKARAKMALSDHPLNLDAKEGDPSVLTRLTHDVKSETLLIRSAACTSLGRLIPKLPDEFKAPALTSLLSMAYDLEPGVRSSLVSALARVIPHLDLGSTDRKDAWAVFHTLANAALLCTASEYLIPELKGEERQQQLAVLLRLATDMGEISNCTRTIRRLACLVFTHILDKLTAVERLPLLSPPFLAQLNDPCPHVREAASRVLSALLLHLPEGEHQDCAFDHLLALVNNDPDLTTRMSALTGLAKFIPALTNAEQRKQVLCVLPKRFLQDQGNCGPIADALKALAPKLDDVECIALYGQLAAMFNQEKNGDVKLAILSALETLQTKILLLKPAPEMAVAPAAAAAPVLAAM